MSNKAKRELSPRRRLPVRLLKIAFGIAGIGLCGVLSCGLVFYAYLFTGEIRTSIDPSLLPTAEYLYQHPQPTLAYVDISPEENINICYDVAPSTTYSALYTDVFINGARVPIISHLWGTGIYTAPRQGEIDRQPAAYSFCVDTRQQLLEPGLHLVELQLKGSPCDTTYPAYQWAVKVGDKSQ